MVKEQIKRSRETVYSHVVCLVFVTIFFVVYIVNYNYLR